MEDKTQQGHIHSHTSPAGVCTITFYHPAHNSLPGKLLQALEAALHAAAADPAAKVVLLQSEGEGTFCAGASFDELLKISNAAEGLAFFSGFANVINAMRRCPKFVLCRVQGKAIGGGVGLASASDYCAATQAAAVKLSELAVGIGPFVVGPAVERKVGVGAFQQLSIDARNFQSAQWAQQHGLYQQVFEDVAALDEHLQELANTLATYSPEAMAAMKTAAWTGTDHWDELLPQRAAVSGSLVLSDFTRDAIARFKAK